MAKKPNYPKAPPRKYNRQENTMVHALDELRAFEEFKREILPALRADLKAGLSYKDLYDKYQNLAAARVITEAMSTLGKDGLAAAKDILDRTAGKPTEHKDVTHRLAKLPDDELNAYLLTKLKDTGQLAGEVSHESEECEDLDSDA